MDTRRISNMQVDSHVEKNVKLTRSPQEKVDKGQGKQRK